VLGEDKGGVFIQLGEESKEEQKARLKITKSIL
jgi:hypothetical protein